MCDPSLATSAIEEAIDVCDKRDAGKGAGKVLLGRCIFWARGRGFERIMVEHETADLLVLHSGGGPSAPACTSS